MKKLIWILVLALLLPGCSSAQTFETMSDEYVQPVSLQTRQMTLALPQDAAALTAQSGGGADVYFCDDYVITVQILDSGDLDKTLHQTTGFGKADLKLQQTAPNGVKRYDWVWSTAGEGEDQVCRGALLDDGVSHYVLTCMTGASQTQELEQTWQELFASFRLVTQEELIRTGS